MHPINLDVPLLILDGWIRWDAMRLLGNEFVPELVRSARKERTREEAYSS